MDTRRAPRVTINLKVISEIDEALKQKFSLASGKSFEVEASDISTSGIGIYSKYFLPAKLLIQMQIDGKPFGSDESMEAKGEVRYCKYVGSSGYKCGVKFTDLSSASKDKIKKFVASSDKRTESRLKLSD